jgi:bifunctional non-homologous end joining protein LigD
MGLQQYKRKRKFADTPEPEGGVAKKKGKLIFVVQRHDATRLHYDFRLQAEGVLKSWAVPKGPSLNPADKRLAVMVEDHPLAYASFEGDIPEGNYGAGHVDIWDKGKYEPHDEHGDPISEEDFLKQLEDGSAKFRLAGKKLKGSFALVQMKGRGEQNWLLIKHRDEFATDSYDSEDYAKASSKKATAQKAQARKSAKDD